MVLPERVPMPASRRCPILGRTFPFLGRAHFGHGTSGGGCVNKRQRNCGALTSKWNEIGPGSTIKPDASAARWEAEGKNARCGGVVGGCVFVLCAMAYGDPASWRFLVGSCSVI